MSLRMPMTDSCDVVRYVSVSCELFSFLVSNLSQVRKLRHLSFTDCGIQPFYLQIYNVKLLLSNAPATQAS